jgi:hypothetical protein
VLLAALMAVAVRPAPPRAPEAVRGHRVLGVSAASVRGVEATLGVRRFAAVRIAQGWEIDGSPANAGTTAALDDLLKALVDLRAVDVFRPRDDASFGLDRPTATIDVRTARGVRRVVVGALNVGGSAFYARRQGAPRVVLVGTLLRSDLERVLFNRDGSHQRPDVGAGSRQRPEMGNGSRQRPEMG